MEENSSFYMPTLPKLIAIGTVNEYVIVLACHLILQDHVIKGSMWRYGQESIKACYHPPKFGDHKHCVTVDPMILVCHVILKDHVI